MQIILSFIILFSALSIKTTDSLKTELWKHNLTSELKKEIDGSLDGIKSEVKREVDIAKQELKADYKNTAIILGAVNVIIIAIGISLFWKIRENAVNRLTRLIDNKLYKVDPMFMPIKIPEAGMEFEFKRLKRLDFRDVKTYQYLDESCTSGAVVLLCENDESAEKSKQFILDKDLKDNDKAIFIVYAKGPKIDPNIFKDFVNVTFANTPLTLVQALFVARRGMVG